MRFEMPTSMTAWVPVGYLLSSAGVEHSNPRFNAPIIPFVAALAMIPLASPFRLFKSNRLAAHQPVREQPSLKVLLIDPT